MSRRSLDVLRNVQKLTCGGTLVLQAALLILIQLSLNFATYVSADLGPAWAIIQAKSAGTSAGSTGPPEVFFGMFRVCYKNPLVSCTPFSFGMKLGTWKFIITTFQSENFVSQSRTHSRAPLFSKALSRPA